MHTAFPGWKPRAGRGRLLALTVPVLLSSPALAAERDLAFPGYSGYLNVPSATVLEHGQADVQWSDQGFVTRGRRQPGQDQYEYFQNVSAAFGVFPNVEIGGRLIWDRTQANCYVEDCQIRDMSANLKVQAPFIPEEWFTLAAGIQDLGGETDTFEAVYAVAGREFGPFEVSVGFGDPKSEGARYLDGAFGAVAYHPVPWLSLMGEYDSQDARLGVGASTPRGWLPADAQLKAKVLAYSDSDTDGDRHFVSVGLSFPFGNGPKRRLDLPENDGTGATVADPARATVASAAPAVAGQGGGAATDSSMADSSMADSGVDDEAVAARVGKRLAQAGYERVKVAVDGDTLEVRWENNVYNRDERDSLRDVAQRVRATAGDYKKARLTLLNQNIPVAYRTLSFETADTRVVEAGFSQPDWFNKQPDWQYKGSYGPAWKPRLTLSPTVSSVVASEYGVWDASVGLAYELQASLWKGALVSGTYNTEVYSTEDFERGGVFYQNRQRNDLVEAEFQQTIKLHPQLYTSFHAGRYALDYDGVLNETMVITPDGRHSMAFLGGHFEHTDLDNADREQALARYSYYNPDLDVQFNVYGGEFFGDDSGMRVDGRFWFGDYALTLTYKNTDAEFVGLGWVIPLTPVKDHQFRYLQLRGNPDWNYSVQTRINQDSNDLSFGGASIVRSANPLQYLYLNRGRLPNR